MQVGDRFNPSGLFTYIVIPDCIKRNIEMSPIDKLVWAQLHSYAGSDGECFPKQTTIAEELGISERSVRNSIQTLINLEFLEVEKPSGKDRLLHLNDRYYFIWHHTFDNMQVTGKSCRPVLANLTAPNKLLNNKHIKPPTPLVVKSSINRRNRTLPIQQEVVPPVRPTRPKPKFIHLFSKEFQDNSEFKECWFDFENYRQSIAKGKTKALTEQSVKCIRTELNKLCGQNVQEACLIIQQTMRNNWIDVYALKGKQAKDFTQMPLPNTEQPPKKKFRMVDIDQNDYDTTPIDHVRPDGTIA